MKPELLWLSLTAMLTGVMFVPYVLDRFVVRGVWGTLKNPGPEDKPQHAWAQRAQRAHYNAVENLVVFAALVTAAALAGVDSRLAVAGCILFFWARAAHYVIYTLGIPVLRTLAFVVGVVGEVLIAIALVLAM